MRRGLSVTMLLVAIVTLLGFVALALDLALLGYTHQQLQSGCESAALAGAAQLMDKNALYPMAVHTGDSIAQAGAITSAQVADAHRVARQFAALNYASGQPIELFPNPQNDPLGDTVVGWVEHPTSLGDPLVPWTGSGPCNSLFVRIPRTRDRGNPVTLGVAKLLGLSTVNMEARARATVDQRIYGFRPVGKTFVPLVPIGIAYRDRQDAWIEQAGAVPVASFNDHYTVDYKTGTVSVGADQIPEVTFRGNLGAGGGNSANAVLLHLGNPAQPLLVSTIDDGLSSDDLGGPDGQLLIGSPAVEAGALDQTSASTLVQTLLQIRGQVRVWPLLQPASGGASGAEIGQFGAGCVVDGYLDGAGQQWIVVVQPGLLQSCTALVRQNEPRNPWIGKLMLTQ